MRRSSSAEKIIFMEIISYNCHGYRGSILFLTDILLKCDILWLQELMISKQDCHILNTCHCDYVGYGVSPYDASSGVLSGRPYGGVGFMWKNTLDECISVIQTDYDWMYCIQISSANKDMYLINVYLPYDCTDNREIYIDYLSKIVAFTSGINNTCITIVGDFNADISKIYPFGSILHDFCIANSYYI